MRSIIFATAMALVASPAFAERNGSAGEGYHGTTGPSASGAYDPNAPTFHTYSGSHASPGAATGGEYGGIGIGGTH